MAVNLRLLHLIVNWAFALIGFLWCLSIEAQSWILLDSQELEYPVRLISADRINNIFVNDSRGNIIKLDSLGTPNATFAPSQYGSLITMEPWASLRLFLYYNDTQQYAFLDRYLSTTGFSEFPLDKVGFVTIAAPSSDNQIWLFDERLYGISKYDFTFNEITLQRSFNQLPENLDIKPHQLTEYQNRVYLGDRSQGILVFDNLGNYLRTISVPGLGQFHFYQEQLYFLLDNRIHLVNLYGKGGSTLELPPKKRNYDQVLMVGSKVVLASGPTLYFYRYNP